MTLTPLTYEQQIAVVNGELEIHGRDCCQCGTRISLVMPAGAADLDINEILSGMGREVEYSTGLLGSKGSRDLPTLRLCDVQLCAARGAVTAEDLPERR